MPCRREGPGASDCAAAASPDRVRIGSPNMARTTRHAVERTGWSHISKVIAGLCNPVGY